MAIASFWKGVLPVLQHAQITLTLSLLCMRFEKNIYHLPFKTKWYLIFFERQEIEFNIQDSILEKKMQCYRCVC